MNYFGGSSVELRENESINLVMKFNAIIATLIDRMETSQSLLKWALIFKLYGLTQVTSCSFSLFFVCCVIVRIIVSCVIWDLLIKAEKCKLDLIV